MNTKGFTLIELISTLIILSIIMIVAVPNTISVLDKSKKDAFISDAKRLVALAESEIRNNDSIDVTNGGAIVFTFNYLDDGSFAEDPDNKTYNTSKSFVVVHKKMNGTSYQLDYYVQLIGEKRGIDLILSKALVQENVKEDVTASDANTAISSLLNIPSSSIVTK